MLRTFPIAVVALMMLLMTGCKNDSESALSEVVDKHKQLISILKDVKDKDSAESAKTKIEALAKDVSAMADKYANKKASKDEMTKAQEKYKPELDEVEKNMKTEMERIMKIPGAMEPISSALMTLGASWMAMANMK